MNYDEQANLVALMWVGRGTYEKEEFEEAVETARAERINATSNYLLGIPLLADYLEEGLEKLGYSVDDVESDVLFRTSRWRVASRRATPAPRARAWLAAPRDRRRGRCARRARAASAASGTAYAAGLEGRQLERRLEGEVRVAQQRKRHGEALDKLGVVLGRSALLRPNTSMRCARNRK